MQKTLNEYRRAILILALGLGLILLLVPVGTAMGALSAMIVEYWFPALMLKTANMAGFAAPWELGAALGFIGAFFKSTHIGK